MVEPAMVKPIVLSDPEDDALLYTAAEGRADVLRPRSVKHFTSPEIQDLCTSRGFRTMTDLDALRGLAQR